MLLGNELIEKQENRSSRVDRHGGRHVTQRDTVEEAPHVVEAVDRHTHLAHLPGGQWCVGVETHLGRKVECNAEPGLSGFEEVFESTVRLGSRAKPGVLAHGPQPPPVHGRIRAAGEGVLPRLSYPPGIGWIRVDDVDFDVTASAT